MYEVDVCEKGRKKLDSEEPFYLLNYTPRTSRSH